MLELLYARELFQFRVEGSFSNARAMAQLRQYYMRLVDGYSDRKKHIGHWESQRKLYLEQVVRFAQNKNASSASVIND